MKTFGHTLASILIVASVLSRPESAFAQGGQIVNFYVVPMVPGAYGAPVPKYLDALAEPSFVNTAGDGTSVMPYGLEPIALVAANLTAAEHASVSAQPDVLTFAPGDFDNPVSAINLTALQTALEGVKIPAGWINGTHTKREVVRFVRQLFSIFQAFHGQAGLSLFSGGTTLDSRWNTLSVEKRNALVLVAAQLGLDTSGVTGGMTLRQILRLLGPQLQTITIMGVPGL